MDTNLVDRFCTRANQVAQLAKQQPLTVGTAVVVLAGKQKPETGFVLAAATGEQIAAVYELAQEAAAIAAYLRSLEAEIASLRGAVPPAVAETPAADPAAPSA